MALVDCVFQRLTQELEEKNTASQPSRDLQARLDVAEAKAQQSGALSQELEVLTRENKYELPD